MRRIHLFLLVLSLLWSLIAGYSSADPVPVEYDTIYSYETASGGEPDGEFVALAVSNLGEIGQAGAGGVNMDFTMAGTECGTRHADSVYLLSASPFLLEANATATEVSLTCSYGQTDTTSLYSWIPVEWDPELAERQLRCYIFTLASCGKFVNRERSIAVEMFRVLPDLAMPGDPAVLDFLTRIYSIDGHRHEHLTFGWVVDWNVPSDIPNHNASGFNPYDESPYMQGTDTVGSVACHPGDRRGATSIGSCSFRSPFNQETLCNGDMQSWGAWHGPIDLLEVVSDPTGGSPPQPDALTWWHEIGTHPGQQAAEADGDLVAWHTFAFDYDLSSTDTVYSWLSLYVLRDGNVDDLSPLGMCSGSGAVDCSLDCPWGMVGDVNGLGGEHPTISDVSSLVDAKFIAGNCNGYIVCMGEADINQSGGLTPECEDITISDISFLIDYLFISGPHNLDLPCVY